MEPVPGLIPPHGNYETLLSYRKAEVVYDLTIHFCHRFLAKSDRTIDQMIQAARSGKQNIAEGSQPAGTPKEMEIKLTNVDRASPIGNRSIVRHHPKPVLIRMPVQLGLEREADGECPTTYPRTRTREPPGGEPDWTVHRRRAFAVTLGPPADAGRGLAGTSVAGTNFPAGLRGGWGSSTGP